MATATTALIFDAANYVSERYTPEPNSGCWLWDKSLVSHGYGNAWDGKTVVVAHRMAYEAFVGPIPTKYQIDHKCRTCSCVNPDHLEAVTQKENLRRQMLHMPIVNGRFAKRAV